MINKAEFGSRLSQQRVLAGFEEPRELALVFCGFSPGTKGLYDTELHAVHNATQNIRNWERGDNLPSLKDFAKLCRILKCDPEYLLYEEQIQPRKETQTAMEITGLSQEVINNLIELKKVDLTRLDGADDDFAYYRAVKKYLFMPTFNSMVGHPQFRVFIAQLAEFLIDRDAPTNIGGPVDPKEYEMGKRTISADVASELMFTRATQTLRQILTNPWSEIEDEVRKLMASITEEKL